MDRWNCGPEAINFMIAHMPHIYSVAGNHDLPNHSLAEVERSAYWTLVQAGKVTHLDGFYKHGYPNIENKLSVCGFSHGEELKPWDRNREYLLPKIAVVHRMCWFREKPYPGADDSTNITAYLPKLAGYDVVLFGDLHSYWDCVAPRGQRCINLGAFMRRRADEIDHRPRIGVLFADGRTKTEELDTTADEFRDREELAGLESFDVNLDGFVQELRDVGDTAMDFADACRRVLRNPGVGDLVRAMVNKFLEEGKR